MTAVISIFNSGCRIFTFLTPQVLCTGCIMHFLMFAIVLCATLTYFCIYRGEFPTGIRNPCPLHRGRETWPKSERKGTSSIKCQRDHFYLPPKRKEKKRKELTLPPTKADEIHASCEPQEERKKAARKNLSALLHEKNGRPRGVKNERAKNRVRQRFHNSPEVFMTWKSVTLYTTWWPLFHVYSTLSRGL